MTPHKRLAIIGAGPSGLISLKFAKEFLPDWEIICYEKGTSFGGSWARTHPGFVSTSTKATTQFSSYQVFRIGNGKKEEFFLHNQYGEYLKSFVEHFDLAGYIELGQRVQKIRLENGQWVLELSETSSEKTKAEYFSHVLICSGLANKLKSVENSKATTIPFVTEYDSIEDIKDKKVVVFGGGESAVDIADRLSQADRNNKVYLSIRSGIRVSPRIHPIRGIPSDYLRNRLMLSIHEDIRNGLGQGFVKFRIKFERLLQRIFPSLKKTELSTASVQEIKAYWNLKINRTAKGKLFNMFHNKSDDFLSSIAEGRISVLGPAVDEEFNFFYDFDQEKRLDLSPDLAINAIGFDSNLSQLSDGVIRLEDFYLGCTHKSHDSLFCVGFARPIIGNIPTIAEMQARFALGQIAGRYSRPKNIDHLIVEEKSDLEVRYPSINTSRVYPVDMFPYCDHLAKLSGIYPRKGEGWNLKRWKNFWLAPASTSQYLRTETDYYTDPSNQEVFTPNLLNFFLILIKGYDFVYRAIKGSDRRH